MKFLNPILFFLNGHTNQWRGLKQYIPSTFLTLNFFKVMKPTCQLNNFLFQQQQNLGQRFSARKMHLSPPVAQAAVCSKAVVLLLLLLFYCLMFFPLFVGVLYLFCYALLFVHSSYAIILKRKRKLVALLL